jgi:hypothetical protein
MKENLMIRRNLTLPEIALIGGTRAALGAGLGLLLADRMKPETRRAVGWTLVAVGVLTTFPLAANVLFGNQCCTRSQPNQDPEEDPAATGHA